MIFSTFDFQSLNSNENTQNQSIVNWQESVIKQKEAHVKIPKINMIKEVPSDQEKTSKENTKSSFQKSSNPSGNSGK